MPKTPWVGERDCTREQPIILEEGSSGLDGGGEEGLVEIHPSASSEVSMRLRSPDGVVRR